MAHLSPTAWTILATLAEHPNSTVVELADLVGIHHTTPHGILPKLERQGLAIRHPGRRGPGGGPDRWRLADGVVAPPAPRPPARRRSGSGRTVRVDQEVYQAILAHKHALQARSGRLLTIREAVTDLLQRRGESAARPVASEGEDDSSALPSKTTTRRPAAPPPSPDDLRYLTAPTPGQRTPCLCPRRARRSMPRARQT